MRVFAVGNDRKLVDAALVARDALGVPLTVPVGVVTKISPAAPWALMNRIWFIPVCALAKLSLNTVAVRVLPVPKSTTVALCPFWKLNAGVVATFAPLDVKLSVWLPTGTWKHVVDPERNAIVPRA
jgi:hypothetical protein